MPLGDEDEILGTVHRFHPDDHAKARRTVALWTDQALSSVIAGLRREDESSERDALLAFLEDAQQERERSQRRGQ